MQNSYDIIIQNGEDSVTFSGDKYGRETGEQQNIGYTPPLQGWGESERRTSQFTYSGANGGHIGDQFWGMRQITIEGWIVAQSYENIERARRLIARCTPINKSINVFLVTPDGKRFGISAKVISANPEVAFAKGENLIQDIPIEILANDPYVYNYSSDGQVITIYKVSGDGGLMWTEDGLDWDDDGLMWDEGAAPQTIMLESDTPVFPTIKLIGKTHNPVFTNKTSDKAIALSLSTSSDDDEIIIDMENEEATLNGVSVLNNVTQKDWWALMPGKNEILFQSSLSDDKDNATMSWREKYERAI